ncbi:MAG: isoleucine--tRNA ligase [Candidatus Liptonbacteria bacterium CG11_big_fil_rev_8_21_14_0_20_35_14]|uniref:isoleucine--tRNA ligase n=1 Tax=Candidatus Liptonbacteria bacterium CG11_big_fil_rev_8_21_14_0_20_35_14 TaxID=1974634 RepID=A0A2H0N7Y9_9BACT|nr:MAG: isoleucine--tRNA ligase [Candidatus Liptonbacteria bacterium CG11_big_fil_rev_8_21_14_0_20_35_14]
MEDKNPKSIREEEYIKFWKENHIFEKSLKQTAKNKPFIFFEGPPSANGQPGIHHIIARTFKDVICRFKTMEGQFVERKAGWDTHGLPVEIKVEKELNINSKKEIENLIEGDVNKSIELFNKKCKEAVFNFKDLWEKATDRMGYWLDTENPYITYEPEYIESLWWILGQIHKDKKLYKGYKVIPWCPRCGTALSSHEISQGYKTVYDKSVYIKFKLLPNQKINNLKTDNNFYISSWTTTPWTLPGNVALAINKTIKYIIVKNKKEKIIIAKKLFNQELLKGEIIQEIEGNDLIDLKYEPIFKIKELESDRSYKIYNANFVETESGTGIVHTAVMYGEDDYILGQTINLPTIHTVSDDGRFKDIVPFLEGLKVSSQEVENKIIAILEKNNNLIKTENYKHEYPFCWRCDSRILYYARSSWFIKMSSLKKELIANNNKVNWVPSHIKNGRFGQWIKDVKDWSLSRERYWATPLPIWQTEDGLETEVIESLNELSKKAITNNNTFYILRHGESQSNIKKIFSSYPETITNNLTVKGKKQVEDLSKTIKANIDIIFSSDLDRTKQTAEILKNNLTIKEIKLDKRLREIDFKENNGQKVKKTLWPSNSEDLKSVRQRMVNFFKEINSKYKDKNILIISHQSPLEILENALENKQTAKPLNNAESRKLNYKTLPLNNEGEIDIHKPFIDEIKIKSEKGKVMTRIKEVADVWFDSGSMPFAQNGYPYKSNNINFPADYICEAIDQTRGWFYTLLAVGTLLKKSLPADRQGPTYKNVISLGHINDEHGKKMSKSKGNVIDPWLIMDKYGADALRVYLLTVNDAGETKNFNETDLKKLNSNVFGTLENSLTFFETYKAKTITKTISKNPLDKWIIERLNQTTEETTNELEKYDLVKATKKTINLIDDLSNWYIRRSRQRFQQPKNKNELNEASYTLEYILLEISKLIAPFAPFISEHIYQTIKPKNSKKSVHLELWPKAKKLNKKILKEMEVVRELSSLALAQRSVNKIKVKQPLLEITTNIKINKDLENILKDEINVKKITYKKQSEKIILNNNITKELKAEGDVREIIRTIQGLRAQANLKPGQLISLYITTSKDLENLIAKNKTEITKPTYTKDIYFKKLDKPKSSTQIKIDDQDINLSIK